jgi:hypothetical protein
LDSFRFDKIPYKNLSPAVLDFLIAKEFYESNPEIDYYIHNAPYHETYTNTKSRFENYYRIGDANLPLPPHLIRHIADYLFGRKRSKKLRKRSKKVKRR